MNHQEQSRLIEDPSDIVQSFPKYEINILCCRYWWIENWEFQDLSFPFWRIYHNKLEGATITYNGEDIPIMPNSLVLIAPYTSYSTRLYNHSVPQGGYALLGGRVGSEEDAKNHRMLHCFIHFNVSNPYCYSQQGVFVIPLSAELKQHVEQVKNYLMQQASDFDFATTISINAIITQLLSTLPNSQWQTIGHDPRIRNAIRYIDKNIGANLDNPVLAGKVNMATNSFIRLFTKDIGQAPQQYIKFKRIEKACILFHHSNHSIEEIASLCGFADRYHFSRIFKQMKQVSPARYKKNLELRVES
ncbi:MAG: helix-turn-helix domain-containing protein [Mangrovibacterium sp.]